jgi:hypothetical protein
MAIEMSLATCFHLNIKYADTVKYRYDLIRGPKSDNLFANYYLASELRLPWKRNPVLLESSHIGAVISLLPLTSNDIDVRLYSSRLRHSGSGSPHELCICHLNQEGVILRGQHVAHLVVISSTT